MGSNKVKLEFSAFTKDGHIKVRNRQGFIKSVLGVWPKSELKIIVQKYRKTRSTNQNAYLWGVVYPMVFDALIKNKVFNEGLTIDLVHDYLKGKFLPGFQVILPGGEIDSVEARHTTTTLTTTEMMEYIMFIQEWAADILGIDIPSPNEQTTLDF